eukprot:1722496-Rhodomonas_salina.1
MHDDEKEALAVVLSGKIHLFFPCCESSAAWNTSSRTSWMLRARLGAGTILAFTPRIRCFGVVCTHSDNEDVGVGATMLGEVGMSSMSSTSLLLSTVSSSNVALAMYMRMG